MNRQAKQFPPPQVLYPEKPLAAKSPIGENLSQKRKKRSSNGSLLGTRRWSFHKQML